MRSNCHAQPPDTKPTRDMRRLVQCPAHIDGDSENPTRPATARIPRRIPRALATARILQRRESSNGENPTLPYDSENPLRQCESLTTAGIPCTARIPWPWPPTTATIPTFIVNPQYINNP